MISQQKGLDYLVPLTLAVLGNDLFAAENLYEGDLLQSVFKIDNSFGLIIINLTGIGYIA